MPISEDTKPSCMSRTHNSTRILKNHPLLTCLCQLLQVQQRLSDHKKMGSMLATTAECIVAELGNAGLLKFFNLSFGADQDRVQLKLRQQTYPGQTCFKVSMLEKKSGKNKKKSPIAPKAQLVALIEKVKQQLKSDHVLAATAPLEFIERLNSFNPAAAMS